MEQRVTTTSGPGGWTKKVVKRKSSSLSDVYFLAEDRTVIRSRKKLRAFLNGKSGMPAFEDFDWGATAEAVPSQPKGTDDRCLKPDPSSGRAMPATVQGEDTTSPSKLVQTPPHAPAAAPPCQAPLKGQRDSSLESLPAVASPQALDFGVADSETGEPVVLTLSGQPGNELGNRVSWSSATSEVTSCSPEDSHPSVSGSILSWDPSDYRTVRVLKSVLHVSVYPATVLCRDEEQASMLQFCQSLMEREAGGTMYVCGCPGTGKSLATRRLEQQLVDWTTNQCLARPTFSMLNCMSFSTPKALRQKVADILQHPNHELDKRSTSIIVLDEMDHLVSQDLQTLLDITSLTRRQDHQCILIGISNTVDLADKIHEKTGLKDVSSDVKMVTFPAYTKDQVLVLLRQRLAMEDSEAFHPLALELCARKVAAATGDMRKALEACRMAVEALEDEMRANADALSSDESSHAPVKAEAPQKVTIIHMAKALAQSFRSPVVDTARALPQHQQMVLCAAVRLLRMQGKDAPLAKLHTAYLDLCRASGLRSLMQIEFFNAVANLADQGLLSVGGGRDEGKRRVMLRIHEDDILFALQDIRFFKNLMSPGGLVPLGSHHTRLP